MGELKNEFSNNSKYKQNTTNHLFCYYICLFFKGLLGIKKGHKVLIVNDMKKEENGKKKSSKGKEHR